MRLRRYRPGSSSVPNDDIGIGSNGDATFSRVQIEDFGGVRTGDGHKPRRRYDSRLYTLLPNDGHAVLQTVDAVRDFREIVLTHFLLGFVEGAVIAAYQLKDVPS